MTEITPLPAEFLSTMEALRNVTAAQEAADAQHMPFWVIEISSKPPTLCIPVKPHREDIIHAKRHEDGIVWTNSNQEKEFLGLGSNKLPQAVLDQASSPEGIMVFFVDQDGDLLSDAKLLLS